MIRRELSIDINSPVEKVFAFLADTRNMLRFMFRCALVLIVLAAPLGWAAASDASGALAPINKDDGNSAFSQSLISLERLLNADGTLNLATGYNGSIDASGWAMRTDASGAPRFVRTRNASAKPAPLNPGASPDDVRWDGRFDLPGANNNVFALAVRGSTLYVGGSFTTIGTVSVNRIASWDNLSGGWKSLANGVNGNVTALAVSGSNLFVGGAFGLVCGDPTCTSGNLNANNIAQWNGSTWSALGSGVNANVYALAISGNNLFAGGLFTLASGLTVNHMAQWNGLTWTALGNGVDGSVNALAVSGSTMYAGGAFTQFCGNAACNSGNLPANRVAQWDGLTWSALDDGLNSTVDALAVIGSNLYAGGAFTQACGNPTCNSGNLAANHIAQWNGATWSPLGNGVDGVVLGLAVSGSNLFLGGSFSAVCGNTACNSANLTVHRAAQWNGASWSALGDGVDNDVFALAASGSNLYIGGFFTQVCGNAACNQNSLTVGHIAHWNGTTWSAQGNGVNAYIDALALNGDDVFAGGDLFQAGGVATNHIARWNGNTWSSLGNGVNGTVQALAVIGSDLFVGGGFTQVCGNPACNSGNLTVNHIARWDGVTWSALGDGVDNPVFAMAVSGNNLYVGGAFLQVCGNPTCTSRNLTVNDVAVWDGLNWAALDNGVKGSVLALAASGNQLYAGGIFVQACASPACVNGNPTVNHIAAWSGNAWLGLDSGVNGVSVQALALSGSDLYVGGFFSEVCGNAACNTGNLTVNNLAKWDGIDWSTVGNGVDGFGVQSLAVSGDKVYVGGTFSHTCGDSACTSGNLSADNIAQWDGATWSALGSGLNNASWALMMSGNDLYVGGNFSAAGSKPSYFFGRWSEPFAVYLPIVGR
jgi:hypothetical protein